jgi:hypothetical protein
MGCSNSKLQEQEVNTEDVTILSKITALTKEQGEVDVVTKIEDVTMKEKDIANKTIALTKEQGEMKSEAGVVQKVTDKEQVEHDVANKANLKKEGEEVTRIATLEASYEAANKEEAEGGSVLMNFSKQEEVNKLAAVVDMVKEAKKEECDNAEEEKLQVEETARIEEKERLEVEEVAHIANMKRLEAEAAARIAEKERLKTKVATHLVEKDRIAATAEALKKPREAATEYYSGFLEKKGADVLGNWRLRYFVARNKDKNYTIEYFEKKGTIDCTGYKAAVFSPEDRVEQGNHGVKLIADKVGGGRTWWLKAETEAEETEWIHVLSRACDKANFVKSHFSKEEDDAARESAPAYHFGMLEKKGKIPNDKVLKWRPRYFVARNKDKNYTIEYFKKKGTIHCHGYKNAVIFTLQDRVKHGDYGVKLVADKANGGRTWWLKAETEAEQAEWVHVLSRACENVDENVDEKFDECDDDDDDDEAMEDP